jgi:tripartite-type tricarboxylate transporter receptor subunit TctC
MKTILRCLTAGNRIAIFRSVGLIVAALLCLGNVYGQRFPTKPVHVVLPYATGGTADTLIRTLAPQLEQYWGQPVVVEFKPGGGTVIGTVAVARAPADGYTVLMVANSLVINAKLHKELPYDALKSFEPVAVLANSPQVLAVNSASPYRSLRDLLDAARIQPGKLSYASVGPATTQHIAGEMLKQAGGVDLIFVPFSGGSPAVTAVLGGHVTAVLANLSEVGSQIDAGRLWPLAVTTLERVAAIPQVPTIAESGYPDYEAVVWFGVVAPAGTPRDVVATLTKGFEVALNAPLTSQRLLDVGLLPAYLGPAAMAAHLAQKLDEYSRAIDAAKIKAE